MSRIGRGALLFLAVTFTTGPVVAQQNYDAGKTPVQLFASDCAICHKSPAGLAKAAGIFGVERFLREHYTSNRQTAAALARYLEAMGEPAAARPPAKRKNEPRAKGADGKPKPDGKKPANKKPGEAKDANEAKPAASSVSTKPAENKPAEAGAADTKPAAPPAPSAAEKPAESSPEKKD